jgi:hypothetical protein
MRDGRRQGGERWQEGQTFGTNQLDLLHSVNDAMALTVMFGAALNIFECIGLFYDSGHPQDFNSQERRELGNITVKWADAGFVKGHNTYLYSYDKLLYRRSRRSIQGILFQP